MLLELGLLPDVAMARQDSGRLARFAAIFPETRRMASEIEEFADIEEALRCGYRYFGAGGFFGEKRRGLAEFSIAAKITTALCPAADGTLRVGHAGKLGDFSEGSWADFSEEKHGGTARARAHPPSGSLGTSRLLSAPLGSSRLLSAPLGSSRLLSAPLGSSRLLSAPLGSSRATSADPRRRREPSSSSPRRSTATRCSFGSSATRARATRCTTRPPPPPPRGSARRLGRCWSEPTQRRWRRGYARWAARRPWEGTRAFATR
ncbi:hypothetical protein EMIHUDRAFT_444864 [Emiliania huxleyi CCMP1516]|uniref:Uncharacterized protein n=2 Tax=Emiliania huxleyi TaxID=2903 RepID=A0A0D3J831_EMIH1|nr:hypothetical protein EMIHUDRAFT_444864 [Emiliania huxleyi CCMP1516]EOD19666.1 hypothetical protein EMIHUDRAFT_444864 [Emiliania huxleyi CCMP1516]|eukprot:XP_005772095.1 hypothetical protein EMIHUDRAFT_444864 [Emiliania huxleyi CCMP1516]